jgi:hypothetical protein
MQRGITNCLIAAAVSLLPWAAAHATPPFYDPGAYCHQATRFAGAEQTYAACYRQEQEAYDRLKLYWNGLTVRSRVYCDGMAEAVGNSYQVLETCVQQQGAVATDRQKRLPRP